MNKFLLFVCSAILIGFNSCSDDDNDGGSLNYPPKQISKIEELNASNTIISTEVFTYDEQGRWIKSVMNTSSSDTYTRTLSYSGNTIQFEHIDSYEKESMTFVLNNNLIVSRGANEDIDKYHYSGEYLKSIGKNYADFEYQNGNLSDSREDGIYEIVYTDIPDKVGFSIFEPSYNDGAIQVYLNNPLFQFGYLGNKSKNLIKSISGDGINITYEYVLDNEGYVLEVIEKGNYPRYRKYQIQYE